MMQPENDPSFIDINNVSFSYVSSKDSLLALKNISMQVRESEFVAVVGPSGCGKSSLLKLVSGLNHPQEGTIDIGSERVTGPSGNCGFAFQNATLLPWRTVIDNILLPIEIVGGQNGHSRRASMAEGRARAEHLLEQVRLESFQKRYPWELSGGMRQRVSLCRALIHQPSMLLLDEPFGALDAFTREDLWGIVQELCVAERPTVFLVTHDLREALFLADTVFVMSARPGTIVLRQEVNAPRPRSIEDTYKDNFIATMHELHSHIQRS